MPTHKKTSFDPILEDYAFFESHSTEAEADLLAYTAHLTDITPVTVQINLPVTLGRLLVYVVILYIYYLFHS